LERRTPDYYLVCEVCNAKIKIPKKLVKWLEEHHGNLGIVAEQYYRQQGNRGFKSDTKVLRFSIEVRYPIEQADQKLNHGQTL